MQDLLLIVRIELARMGLVWLTRVEISHRARVRLPTVRLSSVRLPLIRLPGSRGQAGVRLTRLRWLRSLPRVRRRPRLGGLDWLRGLRWVRHLTRLCDLRRLARLSHPCLPCRERRRSGRPLLWHRWLGGVVRLLGRRLRVGGALLGERPQF